MVQCLWYESEEQGMKEELSQKDKQNKVEYRYYEMPVDSYVLPLLGKDGSQIMVRMLFIFTIILK